MDMSALYLDDKHDYGKKKKTKKIAFYRKKQ